MLRRQAGFAPLNSDDSCKEQRRMNDETHCPKCRGTGLIRRPDGNPVRCPVCAVSTWGGDAFYIGWDDSKKQYDVLLTFPKGQAVPPTLLAQMPARIVEGSRCSCGGLLRVATHSIKRTSGGTIFRGYFICTACKGSERPILGKIQEGILSVWRSITKVKVGGFEIEKGNDRGG